MPAECSPAELSRVERPPADRWRAVLPLLETAVGLLVGVVIGYALVAPHVPELAVGH
jgi:hypothetical protein